MAFNVDYVKVLFLGLRLDDMIEVSQGTELKVNHLNYLALVSQDRFKNLLLMSFQLTVHLDLNEN